MCSRLLFVFTLWSFVIWMCDCSLEFLSVFFDFVEWLSSFILWLQSGVRERANVGALEESNVLETWSLGRVQFCYLYLCLYTICLRCFSRLWVCPNCTSIELLRFPAEDYTWGYYARSTNVTMEEHFAEVELCLLLFRGAVLRGNVLPFDSLYKDEFS